MSKRGDTFDQNDAMIIAMQVRNAMEDFHVKYLSDQQMKELNQIIRQAIYDGLIITKRSTRHFVHGDLKDGIGYLKMYEFLDMSIPDYWEIPTDVKVKKEAKEIATRYAT